MFETVKFYWDSYREKFFSSILKYADKKLKNPSNDGAYESLAPTDDLEKDEYINSLEWAIENGNINNIALTGTYGSGKSSILKTFEKLNPGYEYLNISLASFSTEEKPTNSLGDKEGKKNKNGEDNDAVDINRLIERSILQQIFYKAKPKDVADSRFRRIYAISKERILLYSIFCSIWLFSFFVIFKPSILSAIPILNGIDFTGTNFLGWVWALFFGVGVIYLIYSFFKLFKNLRFSKLNIAKGEIELEKDEGASILNDHLDEILYFFEVNKYDVVIIEDLDRFNDVGIFTKLREINNLLNQSDQIDNPINFVYALKDDLIQDKLRTKFFDFIIPVIPVVNSNNSKEKLVRKIKESGLKSHLSQEFISNVSFYIDDMRILKNIYNEYIVYRNKLNDFELNEDKLFAIIIYKNLYPNDFSKLQKGKGLIPKVFQNKTRFINKLKKEIESEINELKQKIERFDNEKLQTTKELRELYVSKLLRKILASNVNTNNFRAIYVDDQRVQLDKLVNEEYFEDLRNENNIRIYANGNRNTRISFNQIENLVNHNFTYEERKKLINKKSDKEINQLRKKIENLQEEKNEIDSLKLKELLQDYSTEKILNEKVLEKDLLIYLLRNGYIDNMYRFYTSYFYEGDLKREDAEFINSVIDRENKAFEFELSSIEEIVNELHLREFSNVAILNYDLIDYLLKNSSIYNQKLKAIFTQLSNVGNRSVDFIDGFINLDKEDYSISKFIKSLCESYHDFWDFIDNQSDFSNEKKEQYLELIIKNVNPETILKLNKASDNALRSFIADQPDFANIYEKDRHKYYLDLIKDLNVRFKKLDSSSLNSKLFDYIYELNLYEINRHMIKLLIAYKASSSSYSSDKLKKANYSVVKESGCQELVSYIESNIDTYVKKILIGSEVTLEEDEGYFIELLNSENISSEDKLALIIKQEKAISDLSKVKSPKLWNDLMGENTVQPTWENVIRYYSELEVVDNGLIKFLNFKENYIELSDQEIQIEEDSEKKVKALTEEIIESKQLSEASFIALIGVFPYKFDSLSLDSLTERKVKELLKADLFELSPNNYTSLRNNFRPLHINFIEDNIQQFKESIQNLHINEEDLSLILSSSKIGDSNKILVLKSINICEIELGPDLTKAIQELLTNNNYPVIPFELTKALISDGLSKSDKINLVNSQIDNYSYDKVFGLIEALPYPYYRMVRSYKQPSFPKKDYNVYLIEKLVEIGLLSSSTKTDKKIIANAKKNPESPY